MEQVLIVAEADEMARLANLCVGKAEPDREAERIGDDADHEDERRREQECRD